MKALVGVAIAASSIAAVAGCSDLYIVGEHPPAADIVDGGTVGDAGTKRTDEDAANSSVCHGWCVAYEDPHAPMPIGTSADANFDLLGGWCASAIACWVVGEDATILSWDGHSWNNERIGEKVDPKLLLETRGLETRGLVTFTAVSGTGPDDVWVTGNDNVVLHKGPSGWSVVLGQDGDSGGAFMDVWMSAPTQPWIVGGGLGGGNYSTWNSGGDPAWNMDPSRYVLHHISGTSPADLWTCGQSILYPAVPVLRHWNGATWNDYSNVASHTRNIWAVAPDDVWAVGDFGHLDHWNGSTWTPTLPSPGPELSFAGIWGSSPTNIWVVGSAGTGSTGAATTIRWNGKTWSSAPNSARGVLESVFGADASHVWSVGSNQILRYAP